MALNFSRSFQRIILWYTKKYLFGIYWLNSQTCNNVGAFIGIKCYFVYSYYAINYWRANWKGNKKKHFSYFYSDCNLCYVLTTDRLWLQIIKWIHLACCLLNLRSSALLNIIYFINLQKKEAALKAHVNFMALKMYTIIFRISFKNWRHPQLELWRLITTRGLKSLERQATKPCS